MRIRWYDRALIALSALVPTALGALLFLVGIKSPDSVYNFGIKLAQAFLGLKVVHAIRDGAWYITATLLVAGLLLVVWGLRQLFSLLPKSQRESFFNATEMEHGKLSISLQALEHLVTKCIDDHPEFADCRIRITGDEDKARVSIRATLASGVSMPKATAALQKEIVNYLSDCAGIPVSGVNVIVEDTRQNPALPTPAPIAALPSSAPQIEPAALAVDFAAPSEPAHTEPAPVVDPDDIPAARFDESPAPREEPSIDAAIESVAESALEQGGSDAEYVGGDEKSEIELENSKEYLTDDPQQGESHYES
ncbi:MAG: alkaline shock response membrane anchor protein AmaP [Oscillospiraceae bacterium]|jgi:hypothetical protein|nr:alkaline shock response membrane anchor protein AmaP [Oscillospiraceae bacterium]